MESTFAPGLRLLLYGTAFFSLHFLEARMLPAAPITEVLWK